MEDIKRSSYPKNQPIYRAKLEKTHFLWPGWAKNFWAIFVKRPIPIQKTDCKNLFFSELQELEVRAKFSQIPHNWEIWLELHALVAPRKNKIFAICFFGARNILPRDLIGLLTEMAKFGRFFGHPGYKKRIFFNLARQNWLIFWIRTPFMSSIIV